MANGIKLKDIVDFKVADVVRKEQTYLVFFESMTADGILGMSMSLAEEVIGKYDFETYDGRTFASMVLDADMTAV